MLGKGHACRYCSSQRVQPVLIKAPMQLAQTSSSQFILLLLTLFPHAVRWIRSRSCSRMEHEKIQVNFLYFKLTAVTSHWDQFITSVLALPRLYWVRNRLGNTAAMWNPIKLDQWSVWSKLWHALRWGDVWMMESETRRICIFSLLCCSATIKVVLYLVVTGVVAALICGA